MENKEFELEFEDVTADIGLAMLEEQLEKYKIAMEQNDTNTMESILNCSVLSNARIIPE